MSCPDAVRLLHALRRALSAASFEAPADPRLAAEAHTPVVQPRRYLSPLVGAWLH